MTINKDIAQCLLYCTTSDPFSHSRRQMALASPVCFFLCLVLWSLDAFLSASTPPPLLVLISLDGFRYDYLERSITPTLAKLAASGVLLPLQPQYPSYTFPNHYTLVTGRYPASHGIVSNIFYDADLDAVFNYSNATTCTDKNFWNAEPIWSTFESQTRRKSGVLYWAGSEVWQPSVLERYNSSVGTHERFDKVAQWIRDDPSLGFASIYISEIDSAGHTHGPDSSQLNQALQNVDRALGGFVQALGNRAYNLVVVSDHGMAPVSRKTTIFIDELVPDIRTRVRLWDCGPVTALYPEDGELEPLYRELSVLVRERRLPIKVWRQRDVPPELFYSGNSRIAPLILEANVVRRREGS